MENALSSQQKMDRINQTILNLTHRFDELTVDECFSQIGSAAMSALDGHFCGIYVWDHDEEPYSLATIGSDREFSDSIDQPWMKEFIHYLKQIEAPTFMNDPEHPFPNIENFPLRQYICYPIVLFSELLGLMIVLRKDKPFEEDDLFLLRPLANLLGTALPNIYNDSLVELAEICIRFLEEKDPYTHGHSLRVMKYADTIAREYKLPAHARRELKICSLLHDIGKVIIKDSILSKPGRLTDYEFKIMQMHPQIGSNITEKIGKHFAEKILYHHERYDGKGYPAGLKGDEIPLISRIIAIADAFDAMTSRRSYRNSMTVEKALEEIQRNGGTQFDPSLVECLVKAYKEGRFQIIHA
ncbi:MAG: HD domain-containing protein [Planctomycetota bacterium]|nr:MAG: HD domain-containing protein [Planctomycetota bacterium]